MPSEIDTSHWSGEGAFTQLLVDRLTTLELIDRIRVEDAPATRSDADYNFISNEVFVGFATRDRREPTRQFGIIPRTRTVTEKAWSVAGLESALSAMADIGAPDYGDDGMLQYLRTERIVPPYQTRGYKIVELVRIYEVGSPRRSGSG
jgi:hypothetical protein